MSQKVFIFVPINIGRNLHNLLKKKAPETEIISPSTSNEELNYFEDIFQNLVEENLPELIVTLQPKILNYFNNPEIRNQYINFTDEYPGLRHDLVELSFQSTISYIKPLLFVPIIMLVNKELEKPPLKWIDLLDKRFFGRVIAPDNHTPVSIAFNLIFQDIAGDENFSTFLNSMKYSGLPFDVITGVNKGYYDVGLLPLPFARYSMGKNLETVIPQDGVMVLPQMMFLRKNASKETLSIAGELFSKNIQRFFSQLGALIPVTEDIPLPAEIKQNMNFLWKGWDWYKQLIINN